MSIKHILKEAMEGYGYEKSILLGEDHSSEFWDINHSKFMAFKPDFLLLENIGIHRYITARERRKGKDSYVYMDNRTHPGYNSDAFKLADDLNIPMIGIDVWDRPYDFPVEWRRKDKETNFEYSHKIREGNMVRVLEEMEGNGKFLLIVGAEHLRDSSALRKHAQVMNHSVMFFKMT